MLDSLKMPFFSKRWLSPPVTAKHEQSEQYPNTPPPPLPTAMSTPNSNYFNPRPEQQHSIEHESNSSEDNPVDPADGERKLLFQCQQAQGSPTGLISCFSSVKQLYQKIAECFDINVDEILFCTLNTHKVDMQKLLGGQIGLDDFIFVHLAGQPKEIELVKSEESLGLTITDNGAGKAFIKKLKDDSLMAKLKCVHIGDHIERIDGISMIGKRHFEVARVLKDIPIGSVFVIRLVEPLKAGIAPRSSGSARSKSLRSAVAAAAGNGKRTLRLRSTGNATVEAEPDAKSNSAVDRINALLESFLGINDSDLATTIYERGRDKRNTHEFALAIDSSDLAIFGFTDEFIFELWGVVTDAQSGRLAAASVRPQNLPVISSSSKSLLARSDSVQQQHRANEARNADGTSDLYSNRPTTPKIVINGDHTLKPCTNEMQF